ncbi:hypothetical protein LLEC1_06629 [Akanthomyces lecanii]|uniref:non-specific serine/threonine protein kinase n=1 Tax=Cordyceps confragosa TaxID=2714763 RepID=A0A179I8T5_CORDF|nr:hypothetical protein LLEC1_06629 [Akanthomyces lecanii]
MQYVAAHTCVPIPKLYKIHATECGIYIEMEYVQGRTLSKALCTLSTDQTASVFAQLQQYVAALRALPPPEPGVVSSAFGNPAHDGRIGNRFFGPMSVDDFQAQARGRLVMEDVHLLGDEVRRVHTTRYATKFTHADLASRNIIVRGGGDVAAIIDWAFAGWYPEYWEFTKAHYVVLEQEWNDNVRTAVPCYEEELVAEMILWERLPEPGTAMTSYRDGVIREHPGSFPSAAWLKASGFYASKPCCLPEPVIFIPHLYDDLAVELPLHIEPPRAGYCGRFCGTVASSKDLESGARTARTETMPTAGRLHRHMATPWTPFLRAHTQDKHALLSGCWGLNLSRWRSTTAATSPKATRAASSTTRPAWGVLVVPKQPASAPDRKAPGRKAHAFEATDASEIDSATFRMTNPSMDWWYRARLHVNAELSLRFLGQLVVGEIPEGDGSPEALKLFFGKVPLPIKNTDPQQGCVTWSISAVEAMQKEDWVRAFDLEAFKDDALAYADDRIKGEKATEPKLKYYTGTEST